MEGYKTITLRIRNNIFNRAKRQKLELSKFLEQDLNWEEFFMFLIQKE